MHPSHSVLRCCCPHFIRQNCQSQLTAELASAANIKSKPGSSPTVWVLGSALGVGVAILIETPESQAALDMGAIEALQLGDLESQGENWEPFCLASSLKTRGKDDET